MTSILTNNGAMTALATLRATNSSLEQTQNEISTGKKVSSAKDNAAIWAVSKTMETDVSSFKVINDSLGVAESTVSTAMAGANRVTDLLNEMKDLAAGAMTDGTDFGKVQDQIANKIKEITSAINGSQMNGINLLKTDIGNGGADYKALASLDRTNGAATTTANEITVTSVDFEADIDLSALTAITDQASAATALGEIEGHLDTAIKGDGHARRRRRQHLQPARIRGRTDQRPGIRHGQPRRRRHGGGLGQAEGAADAAAAGRAVALHRQPGAGRHHVAVPLIAIPGGARTAPPTLPVPSGPSFPRQS